ncbi:MAG: tetratricopeptide repeat protein [Gemmatimonadetes bacterium]|nr:tetratricopeptide repeat protein [Gemmatimonadota bacterium]
MAIKGSLKEASLADVCQLLALGFKTGRLAVADGSRLGHIFFERGRIVHARIVNQRDRLGHLLVRDGLVTSEQVEQALAEQQRQPHRRFGELLGEQQRIDRGQLVKYVRLQIEEAIYQLFTWSRGNFHFEVDERPDNDILVSINPESLMLEAARRVDEWSLIEQKIPSLDLLFEVEHARLEAAGVQLAPEQQTVAPRFDGTRTVAQVVEETALSEFAVGKALFGLIQAGFAHRLGRRAQEPARPSAAEADERRNLGVAFFRTGMFADATREFARVLELEPADLPARFHLALIALQEGRLRESVRQLKALLEECGPSFPAYINLAVALRALDRSPDALLVLDEAEALRPGEPRTALLRGLILLGSRDLAPAAAALDEYRQRLGPARPGAEYYYNAALVAALRGDARGADSLLEEGLALHESSAPLLLLAGTLAEYREQPDAAELLYRRALEQDPLLPQAHKAQGDAAYQRGAHEEALRCYLRVLELAPDFSADVHARLGNIHFRRGDSRTAREHWERALRLDPDHELVRANLELAGHN